MMTNQIHGKDEADLTDDDAELAELVARHAQAAGIIFEGFARAIGEDRHAARLSMSLAMIADCKSPFERNALRESLSNFFDARDDVDVAIAAALAEIEPSEAAL